MVGAGTDRNPLLEDAGGMMDGQIEAIQEEIREEAFKIYLEQLQHGTCRCPQDNWVEAKAAVLSRHSGAPAGPEGQRTRS